jgi:dihydrofolate reductase
MRQDAPMARLIYVVISSLDGYVADETGSFEWAAPDEEVHVFVNDVMRHVGTQLLGRRMYDVLRFWESDELLADERPHLRDFAQLWRDTDKVVYSRTLETAPTARTRIERDFDPEAVRRIKAAADRDLSVGGPELAGQAIRAGLVDECRLLLVPVIVGGGTRSLPDHVRLELELVDQRRFSGGTVHLHYRVGA